MSRSTLAAPPTARRQPDSNAKSTPRFSPYPLTTLRGTPASTSSSILTAPHNSPYSINDSQRSSRIGPHRSILRKPTRNPFDQLSASDFDDFVSRVKAKVKDALDPNVERKRRKEERDARQRIRDEHEAERQAREQNQIEDVFGEVKQVHTTDDHEEAEESGTESEDDSDESREHAPESDEEPLKFERPKSTGEPVEMIVLDSDEEEQDELREEYEESTRSDTVSSRERSGSTREGTIQDSADEDEEDDDDQSQSSSSSRSPSPETLELQKAPADRRARQYSSPPPSHRKPRASRSPEALTTESRGREQSPLFRPRQDGSVASSATGEPDYDMFVQSEEAFPEISASGEGESRELDYQEVLDTIIDSQTNRGHDHSRQAEDSDDSEREVTRDPFGRPIHYPEADGVDFGGYEEEQGFGQELEVGEQEFQFLPAQEEEEPFVGVGTSYGLTLEDLVDESVKEADRVAQEKHEAIQKEQTMDRAQLEDDGARGAIALTDEEQPEQATGSFGTPALPKSFTDPLDEILQIELHRQELASGSVAVLAENLAVPDPVPSSTVEVVAQDQSAMPLSALIPVTQSTAPNFPTFQDLDSPAGESPEGELLDVDQVRRKELERLPLLQDELTSAFEGYEEDEADQAEPTAQVELQDGVAYEMKVEQPEETVDDDRAGSREGSGQAEREEEEFFGEGVPADEVAPGAELESDDDEDHEKKGLYEDEDSEDLGPRIPWQAKGKSKALPSPSVEPNDPAQFALSDEEEQKERQLSEGDFDDGEDEEEEADEDVDEDFPWRPELLFDYDLPDLERLLEVFGQQLRKARSREMFKRILTQIQDTQDVYQLKGGELVDEDDEDDDDEEEGQREGSDMDVRMDEGEEQNQDSQAADDLDEEVSESPPSPDRSAFSAGSPPPVEDEEALDAHDRQVRDQVISIASHLVDLHSASDPHPSLRIGASLEEYPETQLSSHFRYEDAPQPKLDDPINLPPGPATATSFNEAVEPSRMDEELQPEFVRADEQAPESVPTGQETTVNSTMHEQADQVDQVSARAEQGGMTVIDDDDAPFEVSAPGASQSDLTTPLPSSRKDEDLTCDEKTSPNDVPAADQVTRTDPDAMETDLEGSSAGRDAKADVSPTASASMIEPELSATAARPDTTVSPSKTATKSASPFVPLPAASVPAIARSSGPDLSRFSSHFRYEPDGPAPSLDAPLNLPAPPAVTTSVDDPVERPERDQELEPEIESAREDEVPIVHDYGEMLDLSQEVKPKEADDFEAGSEAPGGGLTIVDDDEPEQASTNEVKPFVATPPGSRTDLAQAKPLEAPSIASQDSMIVNGTAPPQNSAIAPPVQPLSPMSPGSPNAAALAQTAGEDTKASAEPSSTLEVPESKEQLAVSPAADEIRFDADEYLEDLSSSSDDDASDAEVAHELLSPHKRSGGVLGFSGGADDFGETIVMNSDSDEVEDEDEDMLEPDGDHAETAGSDIEEIDLDSVKAALREQNILEELESNRFASEAPSSEPISYNSADEEEHETVLNGSTELLRRDSPDPVDGGPREPGGHIDGSGENQAEQSPYDDALGHHSPLRIHDVSQPGVWDPSEPIEFGSDPSVSAVNEPVSAEPFDARPGDVSSAPASPVDKNDDHDAVVDMIRSEGQELEKDNTVLNDDIAEEAVEALAAAIAPVPTIPPVELEEAVLQDALGLEETMQHNEHTPAETARDVGETVPGSQASTAPVQHAEAIHGEERTENRESMSPKRRSPRRHLTSLPQAGQSLLSHETSDTSSPLRRSPRLSSAAPAPELAPQAPVGKGKRGRASIENGAAASEPKSPTKKPRRSGHSSKLRQEMTDDEEPVANSGTGQGLRVHHHHVGDHAQVASAISSSDSGPPVTRSRCHFVRLRIKSQLNEHSYPYEFLVPACALTSVIAAETMKRFHVENLGPVDESMHCRGTSLGARGFDTDAAKLMHDRHPSNLVPDEDVLAAVRRIVGTEIFDEGEVELLPRPTSAEGTESGAAETAAEQEREMEEGEIEEAQET
ncbi:uncharacterized protein JCM15063_000260 [Sporobolomyces koalae]|uniref:uncharacterized protein n=1 Tax=Sporobolomyces koalae TaxID=500713 RepID=UPI00317C4FDB